MLVDGDDESAAPNAEQIVLTHHPQHAFVVDCEAELLQFGCDSPVAIGRRFQCHLLNLVACFYLDWRGRPGHAPAIETRSA
jgi:hypothetical protein